MPVIWSIRNVEPETRRILEKASDRIGKTLGQYLNEDVRHLPKVNLPNLNFQQVQRMFKTKSITLPSWLKE